MSDHDVSKMKVADLKRELKNRGLNVTGNKNELVDRLQSALIEGDVFDDTAISEELLDDNDDVLNDDELDEETKSFLNSSSAHDEDAILSSPRGSTSSKSPEVPPIGSDSSATAALTPGKKVVLKRKLLPSISLTTETTITTTENKVAKITDEKSIEGSNDASADGIVSNVSKMTMKERLELRAKKFGVEPTGDAAKLVRSERFNVTTTESTNTTASATITTGDSTVEKTAPNVDILKKRAERFGGSVSNTMVNIEQKEKLLKRQERFGSASTAISGTVSTVSTVGTTTNISTQATNEYAEKAKQRLERFKTSAQ